jgi:DNA-binding response OmpR family regulator
LAVDDNVDLVQALADILGMWGHTVRTAHDGLAALDMIKTFAPEVILLDLDLPKLGGLETARRLRDWPDRPSILLVSMSGFGVEQTRLRSRDAGFDHHMVKPIDVDALRSLIEDHARSAESATPREQTPRLRTPAI